MRFENKNAVVTGGAMGIGRAISLAFAREGARVAVVDLDAVQADDTVGIIGEAGGEAFFDCGRHWQCRAGRLHGGENQGPVRDGRHPREQRG